ncbi:DNA repair protein [bacterium 336/3]|nr:DNA repair protein [bacterium 336/3]
MQIQGLIYISNFISEEEEKSLIHQIDNATWLNDLKRRVQHYGYKYDYQKRKIDASMKIGDLPDWIENLAISIYEKGYIPYKADQVIVNEYLAGQGIAHHIDCEPCFDDTIASLSLGSFCTMEFISKDKTLKSEIFLEPQSLLIMADEARYEWLHGIKAKKSDIIEGKKKVRDRRLSLTFRKIK